MRFFASRRASATVAGRGRPESAPATRRHDLQLSSSLAKQLTKPTSAASRGLASSRRKKNAVHPMDRRDFESLESLPSPQGPSRLESIPAVETEKELTRSYTVTVAILHALDLPNPCQVRSCPHAFIPCVEVSLGDEPSQLLSANRHTRNYSSWSKNARLSRHFSGSSSIQANAVRVRVGAHCTRYQNSPEIIEIGWLDSFVLPVSPDAASQAAHFLPVFRHQVVKGCAIKYYAGKVKLSVRIDPGLLPAVEIPRHATEVCVADGSSEALKSEQPDPSSRQPRPSFLPLNFGDALQQKRKQLKATVAPTLANHAIVDRQPDNPVEARETLEQMQAQFSDLIVRVSDVHVLETIGEGVHATVHRVRLNSDRATQDIAMKEFRYNRDSAQTESVPPLAVMKAFRQELGTLRRVAASNHSTGGTVQLLGVMLTPRLAIFTDFCSSGSLAHCMQNHASWSDVSMSKRIDLAVQISTGLAFLHSIDIVHRDIKTHNIMVDGLETGNPVGKIGDLGSAVVRRPSDPMLLEETGSSGYTAPEVFETCGYNEKVDVWSLGIVLWELFVPHPKDCRPNNPFLGVCGDELVRLARQGVRPELPRDSAAWISSLLEHCWQLDPSKRPSADAIARILHANTNIY